MTKQLSLLIVMCCLTTVMTAMNFQCALTASTAKIKVLIINSVDELKILNSTGDSLSGTANANSQSTGLGWLFPRERPAFEFNYHCSGDTAYLLTPQAHKPKTIGIIFYSERIETTIKIPNHIEVIVKKAENIKIEGVFQKLDIQAALEIHVANLDKNKIQHISCTASKILQVNGNVKKEIYDLAGNGKIVYKLKAKKIVVTIKN